ncbi:transmembrane protein 176B-like [Poeciliopsis prolifica]|uniref:transmembrane protein 176B-like n=1 Tax=Poeciliopsis prolifica TaxID=188132 RepID=UPI00241465E4|nr:transmembrane protein 176B-like [Poeciliopsis prolifica]
MSVTMARNDGVTVFTVQSDPQSRWPPVCQILKSLCYSPLCCSLSPHVRKIQGTSSSVLGAMQIMIGLLNLGLGGTLRSSPDTWFLNSSEFPYWLGALFITFGVMCVLSEKFPSLCLVILNVILNLVGVGFAIAAIVLYSIYIAHLPMWWWWNCSNSRSNYFPTPPSQSETEFFSQMCLEGSLLSKVLLIGMNVVLIVLSIMELCVVISTVVLGIKTLRNSVQEQNTDAENTKPLMEAVSSDSTA